ncbi:MATE family efflux transporter [bacterium]|nr:MATE family efflux transporter [bacterium]
MKNVTKLTEGSIRKKIIILTLTMMVGILSMVVFNIVDTIFIGRLGIIPLTAMSFTFPVIMFVTTISLGLGIGATAVVSRAIGKKEHLQTKRLTTDSLFLSLTIVVIISGIGLLTIDPLFKSLGAKGEILRLIREYMVIWYFGVPFVIIPMVGNSAIRATGNTAIPSMIMLIAVFVNIVLDPLLIFGIGPFPRLELRGAAIATVIARAITFAVSLLFLRFKFDMLSVKIPKIKEIFESWKKILFIGIPAAATQAIRPLALGVITRIISGFGVEAVAGLGVSSRIEMLAISPILALGVVLVPFIGQNMGANKIDRVKKAVHFSWICSIIWGGLIFLVFLMMGKNVGSLFNNDSKVISVVYLYLVIISASYGFHGISVLTTSVFNAMHKPLQSTLLNVIKMLVLYIPFAWIGSVYWGIKGIFSGIALSSFLTGIIAVFWMNSTIKKLVKG